MTRELPPPLLTPESWVLCPRCNKDVRAFDAHTCRLAPSAAGASERDWPEDFSHENGNYQNQCVGCGEMFKGHKRRVVCRACDDFQRGYDLGLKQQAEELAANKRLLDRFMSDPVAAGSEPVDDASRWQLAACMTWITLSDHRDKCRKRYGEPCSCGRDSILAATPSALPPMVTPPEVRSEDIAYLKRIMMQFPTTLAMEMPSLKRALAALEWVHQRQQATP